MEIKDKNGLTEKEFLDSYNPGDYERPSVTVDLVIVGLDVDEAFNPKLKVLLIKRKNHPYINKWALPGGFVNITEDIDDAAKRELEEETGVKNISFEQLKTYGKPDRDPRMRVISVAYFALLNCSEINKMIQARDDELEAKWFEVTLSDKFSRQLMSIKSKDGDENVYLITNQKAKQEKSDRMLAFDHAQIIYDALSRIRNEAEYTDIVFGLMPEKFKLPELKKVYECILGKELDSESFQERIQDKLIEIEEIKKKSHKSSQEYDRKLILHNNGLVFNTFHKIN